jgi:hypothetical protein
MKKTSNPKPRTTSLTFRKETLHRLDSSQLQEAAGGVRIWKPTGYAEDTTPIYYWVDDTNG